MGFPLFANAQTAKQEDVSADYGLIDPLGTGNPLLGPFEVPIEGDYGLLPPQETVIIRPYGDDSDDMMLSELRPRWIIMYDPNQDFLRRVEAS